MDLDSFRKEPVVGLSYVTEFQSILGIKCICHLCGILFSQIGGQHHVTSFQHRFRFMREKRPEDYECICRMESKKAMINVMYRVLGRVEWYDGRGTPTIYVFDGGASLSDNQDTAKFRQAFGEFVTKELHVARQRITDDPVPFDDDSRGVDTLSDESEYVQLYDLGGERASFFDKNATDFTNDLGWEFPEERRFFGGAGTTEYGQRGPPNEQGGVALVPDYDSSYEDDDDDVYNSSKLGATDVSGPSSVNKGRMEKKGPSIKPMNSEKESEQKNEDQERIEENNKPKQEGDDKGNSEEKETYVAKTPTMLIPRHELGKNSLLKKLVKGQAKGPVIGLSAITEYQHVTGVHCLCNVCAIIFVYRSGMTHMTGYKHRMRYLRSAKPKLYARLSKLQSRKEITAKLLPIVKDIEAKEGCGTPIIEVFKVKDSENDASNSASVSDKQNQDSSEITEMSEAEIVKQHHDFIDFINNERSHQLTREVDPVPFEPSGKPSQPSDERFQADPQLKTPHRPPIRPGPLLQEPQLPDPRFQQKPMRPDPYMREHDPYYMRMRTDPYFKLDHFERMRRERPYPGEDLFPYPMKRVRPDDPYLDPDPLKRIRPAERHLDPDPLKRRAQRQSYLDLHPKRLRFDEPYIDPDPLKRILPSQKAAAKKPVVIDYGHGTEKKKTKNTADQWEQDIKDILNESKGPDSLAQLSCSYSSPKKEDTPPPSQPKRQLPFSRSYMEKSKELRKKSSSFKKERSPDRVDSRGQYKSGSPSASRKEKRKDSPDRKEPRGRYRSRSPSSLKREKKQDSLEREDSRGHYKSDPSSRRFRRSGKLLSVEHRRGAKLEDLEKSRFDTSPKRQKRSKSPEIKDSTVKKYKRSKSPEDFKVIQKDKDETLVKRKITGNPVEENLISSSREKDKYILPLQKSSSESKDLPVRESKKSKSPERVDLNMKFKDKERLYDTIGPNSTNPEVSVIDSPMKTFSKLKDTESREDSAMKTFTKMKDTEKNHPEITVSRQKELRRPETFIDLTSEEEIDLHSASKKDVHPAHTDIGKSSPKKESKPETSNDVDEAQADLIAEMLLKMKSSLIGQDLDPEIALKTILSQDITKVLLATKELEKKESPPKVKEAEKRDSLERHREEKDGSSERLISLKSKVKKTPAPAREKVTFSFAGRSRASGNLVSQTALHFSDEDDDDEMENN